MCDLAFIAMVAVVVCLIVWGLELAQTLWLDGKGILGWLKAKAEKRLGGKIR